MFDWLWGTVLPRVTAWNKPSPFAPTAAPLASPPCGRSEGTFRPHMETSRRHKGLCSAALLDVKLNPTCPRMFHMLDDPQVKLLFFFLFLFFFFFNTSVLGVVWHHYAKTGWFVKWDGSHGGGDFWLMVFCTCERAFPVLPFIQPLHFRVIFYTLQLQYFSIYSTAF